MRIDVRTLEGKGTAEFYITATPSPGQSIQRQAEEIFGAIAKALRNCRACIFEERVFASQRAVPAIDPVRASAYADLDDGVPPTWLAVPATTAGEVAGVQLHAVRCCRGPEPLRLKESAYGRLLKTDGGGFVALGGISAPECGPLESAQARAMFEKAEAALAQVGANMNSIARTWLWLGDILSWYGDLNSVRTRFFKERGLIDGRPEGARMPASTGIGVFPAGEARCALDLVAVLDGSIQLCGAAGTQNSAFNYGSAFSRAARATSPAGEAVYVSGTAAIDTQGRTEHAGDATAQIDSTMRHVRAVLEDMKCADRDVVQAIAYCTTPQVMSIFQSAREYQSWPWITIIADICRPDLLFEVEATAAPGARALNFGVR